MDGRTILDCLIRDMPNYACGRSEHFQHSKSDTGEDRGREKEREQKTERSGKGKPERPLEGYRGS